MTSGSMREQIHQTFPNTQMYKRNEENPKAFDTLCSFVILQHLSNKKAQIWIDDLSHPKSRNSVGESVQLATLGCAPLAGKEAQSTVVNWDLQFFALSFLKWMKIVNLRFFLNFGSKFRRWWISCDAFLVFEIF